MFYAGHFTTDHPRSSCGIFSLVFVLLQYNNFKILAADSSFFFWYAGTSSQRSGQVSIWRSSEQGPVLGRGSKKNFPLTQASVIAWLHECWDSLIKVTTCTTKSLQRVSHCFHWLTIDANVQSNAPRRCAITHFVHRLLRTSDAPRSAFPALWLLSIF